MYRWTGIHDTRSVLAVPTCLAKLRGASALAWHANHGLHFGTNAGAPLLVISSYHADRRVWLAAVCLLQVTHVATDACALGHVHPAWGAHLPVFHFRCKVTVSHHHWQRGMWGQERRGGDGEGCERRDDGREDSRGDEKVLDGKGKRTDLRYRSSWLYSMAEFRV